MQPNPPGCAVEVGYQSHPGCRARGPVATDDDLRSDICQLDQNCFNIFLDLNHHICVIPCRSICREGLSPILVQLILLLFWQFKNLWLESSIVKRFVTQPTIRFMMLKFSTAWCWEAIKNSKLQPSKRNYELVKKETVTEHKWRNMCCRLLIVSQYLARIMSTEIKCKFFRELLRNNGKASSWSDILQKAGWCCYW